MKLIFSVSALTILATFVNATPVEIPGMAKRSLDLSVTKSSCGASEAKVSCENENSTLSVFSRKHGNRGGNNGGNNGNNGNNDGSTKDPQSCCLETEGLILQTQFWDYDVPGVADSWTIHGLWPDKCDGSYDANCGFSPNVQDVKQVLVDAGETELVSYMSQYWKNQGKSDESLWLHEYNKHGTCMSTLAKSCYPQDAKPNQNVVDWAKLTVKHFQGLPTYKYLAEAGITPSSSKTYDAADVASAIAKGFGKEVYLGCRNGQLNEVWYFHKVKGSLLDDQLQQIDSVSKSTCSGQIKYLPKQGSK